MSNRESPSNVSRRKMLGTMGKAAFGAAILLPVLETAIFNDADAAVRPRRRAGTGAPVNGVAGVDRVVWVKSAPWKYLATLRVICGVEVVEFTDNPSRDQLAQVARAWGGALVVLSEDPTPLGFDPNSVPFAPNVVGTQWERRISGPPRAVLTRNDAVWAWSLAPDGSLTQLSAPTP